MFTKTIAINSNSDPQLIRDAGHSGICAAANTSLVFIIVTTGQKVGDEPAFDIQIKGLAKWIFLKPTKIRALIKFNYAK